MTPSAWFQPTHAPGRVRLVRYFTVTSLAAFLAIASVLYFLQWKEGEYFRQVQLEQLAFVKKVNENFAQQQEEAARRTLLLVHEAAHVDLTRVLANALWHSHLSAFFLKAQKVSLDECRKLANASDASKSAAPSQAGPACYAAARQRIMAIPEFRALDAKVTETMSKTAVFKIKVFDTRGMTIYSSEHAQIGEDKRDNAGWSKALKGQPASELTRRDRFSAFEGVVENRDLISSYIPVYAPGGAVASGVFEIYSDITPFLATIKSASSRIGQWARANREELEQMAAASQQQVKASSDVLLMIVGGLFMVLYLSLFLIVRNGQRIIEAQARVQEQSIRREERWHREKMSVLATMAATIGHEIGNPLAIITAVAEEIAERQANGKGCSCSTDMLLDQCRRIAVKTRQIQDFAAAHGETAELVNVNDRVRAVCEFLSFDRRFGNTSIDFHSGVGVPAQYIVSDYLTEVLMNLLQMYVEDDGELGDVPRRVVVETRARGAEVLIRISCEAQAGAQLVHVAIADSRWESIRRRLAAMGGGLTITGGVFEITLSSATKT